MDVARERRELHLAVADERPQRATAHGGERLRAQAVERAGHGATSKQRRRRAAATIPRVPAASVIRERLRRAAHAAGVEPQAAAVYRLFDRTAARDHRDNEHLTAILAACLAADANCIDIGAHTGGVLRDMVRCAPEGRHIAFEPLPELAAALGARVPERGRPQRRRVRHRRRAGVHLPGLGSDAQQPRGGGRGRPPPGDVHQLRVRTERLDDVLPGRLRPGADQDRRRGRRGRGVPRRRSRRCGATGRSSIFEHGLGGADRYGSGPDEVWGLLADDVGLRIYDLDGRGPYSRQEFVNVFEQPIWNFLARP